MRFISQQKAIGKLRQMCAEFAEHIRTGYEHRALPCSSCSTPGACCLDAHFVNVRISRLEAAAIAAKLNGLENEHRNEVSDRIDAAIEKYDLTGDRDESQKKFACPLFEPSVGCLVHDDVKPVACVVHACYEKWADLPPEHLQTEQELRIDRLNVQTYGRHEPWLPLPVAIKRQIG